MRAKEITITALFIGMIASSCLTDTIRPDVISEYSEKLVVNSVFTDQDEISVQVSNSSAAFSSDVPTSVSDASVRVFQNTTEHVLTYDGFDALYRSTAKVTSGDAITVEISHPELHQCKSCICHAARNCSNG